MAFRWEHLHSTLVLFALANVPGSSTAAFDLPGPRIEVRITRSGNTLPIAQVPNLQPGDRIWVHPKLPPEQSVHYLLIAAFLRCVTNPPPATWFTKAATWNKQVREEGIVLTVPRDAQHLLLFLAPETGGDFSTLRSAVWGKPGAYVRASKDLNWASLARSRWDAYLNALRGTSDSDPKAIHDRSVLLARSLSIKLGQQCFDKPSAQQAPCLMQNTDQLVMEDGHSQSMFATLTSGAGSDLIGQLSTARVAGGGAYSPYVGAFVDLARLLEGFHTARYQYIPALALPKQVELNLKLNNPPSFHKPMSVLVFTLPPIEATQIPPLRAANPSEAFCLQKPSLVLPVEGAPLVFSTDLAHDVVLQVKTKSGPGMDLPATADAARGGFLIDARKLRDTALDGDSSGMLHGNWGFQAFDGPSFRLRSAHSTKWTVPSADQTALIVGRDDALHLLSDDATCVDQVTMRDREGNDVITSWKVLKPGVLEVQIPLTGKSVGPVTILVKQHGLTEPDAVRVQSYSEAGRLDEFIINAGDPEGILRGTRLDEVAGIEFDGVHFIPAGLSRAHDRDELRLSAPAIGPVAHRAGDTVIAHVALKDGRSLNLPTIVAPPRPSVTLISKSVDPGPSAETIHLGGEDEVPQDGKLSFFLKTEIPAAFPRNEQIEVETEDGSYNVLLSLEDGTLILEDSQNALAELDLHRFNGRSAFGPLRFRPVHGDRKGDWQQLATLVRAPSLTEIRCPDRSAKQCTLSGSNLFLIDSIASDPDFTESVSVSLGSVSSTVRVPHPGGAVLYIKLRDNPSVVNIAAPVISYGPNTLNDRRRRTGQGPN